MRRVIGLVLCLVVMQAFASDVPTLEERMSKDDFHAAGLDKLSPQELKALNDWLAGHAIVKTVTKVETATGKPVFDSDVGDRQPIEAHIAGRFSGWFGKTTFTLDNGQEWTQAESGQFSNGNYDHPRVKIKPMLLGSWLMYVDGCGCSVRVVRSK